MAVVLLGCADSGDGGGQVFLPPGGNQFQGTDGNDEIFGTNEADTIRAEGGADIVIAGAGDDAILGDVGDDLLFGDAGRDWIDGGDGADVLRGGDGDDVILISAGSDLADGGAGSDTFEWLLGAVRDIDLNTIKDLDFDDGDGLVIRNSGGQAIVTAASYTELEAAIAAVQTLTIVQTEVGVRIDYTADSFAPVPTGAGFALKSGGQQAPPPPGLILQNVNPLPASLPMTFGTVIEGATPFRDPGRGVSEGLDINADGIDDFAVSAENPSETYVVFGREGGLPSRLQLAAFSGSNGFALSGRTRFFGEGAIASLGDSNGDGIDDLLVGDWSASATGAIGGGQAYVVFGSHRGFAANIDVSSLDGRNGFSISGSDAPAQLGTSVSRAGDLNNDGIADLIVGSGNGPIIPARFQGAVNVVYGSRSRSASDLAAPAQLNDLGYIFVSPGEEIFPGFGDTARGRGDVNGDSIDDILMCAPIANGIGVVRRGGECFVVFGLDGFGYPLSDVRLNAQNNGFRFAGDAELDEVGSGAAMIGDLNGDGFDDLATTVADDGAAVIFGSRNLQGSLLSPGALDGALGFQIVGLQGFRGPSLHYRIAGVGDVNGDGLDDLLVGSTQTSEQRGAAYLVFGRRTPFSSTLDVRLMGASQGYRLAGISPGDFAGLSVAGAGDVNNDGSNDLLIAAPFASPNGNPRAGEVYLVYGGADLLSRFDLADGVEDGAIDLARIADSAIPPSPPPPPPPPPPGPVANVNFTGVAVGDGLGLMVSGVGDVNNDGFDDVLLGAPFADPRGATEADRDNSRLYLVFGSPNGIAPNINLATLSGSEGYLLNGHYSRLTGLVADTAGDINGDQFADILIGSQNADANRLADSGQAYVLYGGTPAEFSSLDSLDGLTDGIIELSLLGDTVSQPGHPFAPAPANDPGLGFVITGGAAFDHLGSSVSNAGDLNGDGTDDLIVGASAADGGGLNRGVGYVVFGNTGGIPTTVGAGSLDGANGVALIGASDGDGINAVESVGDVNGDGIDDVFIGALQANPAGVPLSGAGYVVYGSRSPFGATLNLGALDGTNGSTIVSNRPDALTGSSVSGLGDVNGDGLADIAITSRPDPSGMPLATDVHVLFGVAGGFGATVNLANVNGANGFVGSIGDIARVAAAGDVNGDGFQDVLVAAAEADVSGLNDVGTSYLVFGSANGLGPRIDLTTLNGTNGYVINGPAINATAGRSVSRAGDVNGDGLDDLLIGAPGLFAIDGPLTAGEAYLIMGGSLDGLDAADGNVDGRIDLGLIM